MSFSNEVKNESARVKINSSSEMLAEFSGLIRMCGNLKLKNNSLSFEFISENASVVRRIYTFLRNYSDEIEAFVKRSKQLKRKNVYVVLIDDIYVIDEILYDTGFVKNKKYLNMNYSVPKSIVGDEDEIKAFIRGSFLGAGSISNPEKSYHMEMLVERKEHGEYIKKLLNSLGFNAKIAKRKQKFIVYLKEAEQISDFLAVIGAHQALLRFENIRVVKDLRNNVNRIVNCETANLTKTVNASTEQIKNIEYLIEKDEFKNLDYDLKEVAQARIHNRNASLSELEELLDNKYTKSKINYKLKKINKTAMELRGVDDERNEGYVDKR